jgi:putative ABC transport system permease protein
MFLIALKMLFGDSIKFLTLVIGLSFAVMLIAQQSSIFCGLMLRTGSTIFDTGAPIWVMDSKVTSLNDSIPLVESDMYRVRNVAGVAWAVPMSMQSIEARADDGTTGLVQLIGVDEQSLMGLPPNLLAGRYEDLNQPNAVLITADRSERYGSPRLGDYFQLNDRRVKVVGIVEGKKNFTPFPSVYTTYPRAKELLPPRSKYMSFILAKAQAGEDPALITQRITQQTGLQALTQWEFFWLTMLYWAKNTGIPINFGITIVLGVIVGAAIAGQTLYTFVIENRRQFGTFKALGIHDGTLMAMVLLQSVVVGLIGFGIGSGLVGFMGLMIPPNGSLGFYTPWEVMAGTFVVVMGFCVLASIISIRQLLKVDPAIVFRG